MKPSDFQPDGYWRQRTRGPTRDDRRPIWRINHPDDNAFYALVTLSPPSWRWEVYGRCGMHKHGYNKRKLPAMHEAIQALDQIKRICQ